MDEPKQDNAGAVEADAPSSTVDAGDEVAYLKAENAKLIAARDAAKQKARGLEKSQREAQTQHALKLEDQGKLQEALEQQKALVAQYESKASRVDELESAFAEQVKQLSAGVDEEMLEAIQPLPALNKLAVLRKHNAKIAATPPSKPIPAGSGPADAPSGDPLSIADGPRRREEIAKMSPRERGSLLARFLKSPAGGMKVGE